MVRSWLLITILGAGLGLGGCAVHASYIHTPPPAPRVEVYGYAPGPGYVWVNGFWAWGGSRYVWRPGYWVRPPRHYNRWQEGRWERDGRGYRYHEGHWR
jgi:WXXGXW repeat (2 copies)